MLLIKEYCTRLSQDYYGGSLELVDDGITSFVNELREGDFQQASDVESAVEGMVDQVLESSTAILPLINFLDAVMRFVESDADPLPLADYLDRFIAFLEERRREQNACTDRIAAIGARLVQDGDKVGTFSTSGTIYALMEKVLEAGKRVEMVAFEARPHSEGFRTLEEISSLGIPVCFGVDALLCELVPGCQSFVIGVDAINALGDVYAKTGSYLAALACREFGIPFYVAADTSKFDLMSVYGYPLKSSERPYQEVSDDRPIPEGSVVKNISFELVPAHLIKGIITEKGLISPASVFHMMNPEAMSSKMVEKLGTWLTSAQNLIRKE